MCGFMVESSPGDAINLLTVVTPKKTFVIDVVPAGGNKHRRIRFGICCVLLQIIAHANAEETSPLHIH